MNSPVVQLGEVADFLNGCAFKPEDWSSEGLPIIRIQNLTGSGSEINRTMRKVPEKYRVRAGDLLVSWSASLGVFQWDGPEALVNQHIFKVIPNLEKVNLDYLRHAIDASIHQMERFTHGSTMKHINRKEFLEHSIPLPPLVEQRRIAAILDKADALRCKRKGAIDLIDSLSQSIFLEMFGSLSSNSQRWASANITDVCELIVDCVNRTAPVVDYATPYKMLRTTNVRNGRVDVDNVRFVTKETFDRWNRRTIPRSGDVLLTREAPVGGVGMLATDDQVFLGQRLMLYRPKRDVMTSEFLVWLFSDKYLRDQFDRMGSGSTVKHLPLPACRAFEVRVPPIALQKLFSERISLLKATKSASLKSDTQISKLFSSLQSRAFSGQL